MPRNDLSSAEYSIYQGISFENYTAHLKHLNDHVQTHLQRSQRAQLEGSFNEKLQQDRERLLGFIKGAESKLNMVSPKLDITTKRTTIKALNDLRDAIAMSPSYTSFLAAAIASLHPPASLDPYDTTNHHNEQLLEWCNDSFHPVADGETQDFMLGNECKHFYEELSHVIDEYQIPDTPRLNTKNQSSTDTLTGDTPTKSRPLKKRKSRY